MSRRARRHISAYPNAARGSASTRARAGGRDDDGRDPWDAPVRAAAQGAGAGRAADEAAQPAAPAAGRAARDGGGSGVRARGRSRLGRVRACAGGAGAFIGSAGDVVGGGGALWLLVLVHSAGPPLLWNAHRHLDRRALESEGLTQAAGDEP